MLLLFYGCKVVTPHIGLLYVLLCYGLTCDPCGTPLAVVRFEVTASAVHISLGDTMVFCWWSIVGDRKINGRYPQVSKNDATLGSGK